MNNSNYHQNNFGGGQNNFGGGRGQKNFNSNNKRHNNFHNNNNNNNFQWGNNFQQKRNKNRNYNNNNQNKSFYLASFTQDPWIEMESKFEGIKIEPNNNNFNQNFDSLLTGDSINTEKEKKIETLQSNLNLALQNIDNIQNVILQEIKFLSDNFQIDLNQIGVNYDKAICFENLHKVCVAATELYKKQSENN